jgi:hypothetical protein
VLYILVYTTFLYFLVIYIMKLNADLTEGILLIFNFITYLSKFDAV